MSRHFSEEECKTKWCPFVRMGSEGNRHSNVGVDKNAKIPKYARCIGSDCMLWVLYDENPERGKIGRCGAINLKMY